MKRSSPATLPTLFAQTAFASWEVIARRSMLMATGACSPAEYNRMVMEKTTAMMQTGLGLATGATAAELMRPWHAKTRANAKRLRKG